VFYVGQEVEAAVAAGNPETARCAQLQKCILYLDIMLVARLRIHDTHKQACDHSGKDFTTLLENAHTGHNVRRGLSAWNRRDFRDFISSL